MNCVNVLDCQLACDCPQRTMSLHVGVVVVVCVEASGSGSASRIAASSPSGGALAPIAVTSSVAPNSLHFLQLLCKTLLALHTPTANFAKSLRAASLHLQLQTVCICSSCSAKRPKSGFFV